MNQRTTERVTATTGTTLKNGYEASVIGRAMGRAGSNPHLKGHIHEVLTQDRMNIGNLFRGKVTSLTRNSNASTVDLVTTQGSKVVERIQLKDAVSPSSINKLVKQVAKGKYRSTQLCGTEETAKLFNAAAEKAGLSKRMSSTGISTQRTTQLAQRAGAAGSGTLAGAAWAAAKSGGAVGAGVGVVTEVVGSTSDWVNGRISDSEMATRVVKAGAKGGVTGAAAGAAATAGGALVTAAVTGLGASAAVITGTAVAAPLLVGGVVAWGVSSAWNAIFD